MNYINKKRAFVALNLPSNAKKNMAYIIDHLNKDNRGVKWINPEGLHLTLHFLYNINSDTEDTIKKIMQSYSGRFKKFIFKFYRFNAFPNLNKPRVIFLQGEQVNGKSVYKLQELLGQDLKKINIPVDYRSWKPHLTLGRVKNFSTSIKLLPLEYSLPIELKITTYELMESELTPQGAIYKVLASYNL